MFLIDWLSDKYEQAFRYFCQYPVALIPQANYRCPIELNLLADSDLAMGLSRRSNNSISNTFEGIQGVRADALFSSRSDGKPLELHEATTFSLNLMGGEFKPEHCKFRQIKSGSKNWESGEKVSLWKHRKCYKVEKLSVPIYYPFAVLDRIEIPFIVDNKEVAKRFGLKLDPNTGEVAHKASVEVRHFPTNLNYWHSSLVTTVTGIGVKTKEEATVKGKAKEKHFKSKIAGIIAIDILVEGGLRNVSYDNIDSSHYHT